MSAGIDKTQLLIEAANASSMATSSYGSPISEFNTLDNVVTSGSEQPPIPSSASGRKAPKLPQLLATAVACLSAVCIGTILGYSSPTILELTNLGVLNDETESWFASIITLGALFGGLVGGFLMERLGRKGTMLACGVPMTIAWFLILVGGTGKSAIVMLIGRALSGATLGIICIVLPNYIAEIASPELRGILGTFFQVASTSGILLTYMFGIWLKWQWLALCCSALATFMVLVVICIPESPTYLARTCGEAGTLKALKWLRGSSYDYLEEYNTILQAQNNDSMGKPKLGQLLRSRSTYRPIAIVICLMAFQQISGINDFIFYTEPIFRNAGYVGNPALPSVIIAAVQVGATIIAIFVMDIAGRRILLIGSGSIMAISCITLGLFYFLKDVKGINTIGLMSQVSLIMYILAFSFGWGPIPWLLMAELIPTPVKGFASSLAVAINWLCGFLVTKEFIAMEHVLTKQGVFWLFAAINILATGFVAIFVPETKGKSLNEIRQYFESSLK